MDAAAVGRAAGATSFVVSVAESITSGIQLPPKLRIDSPPCLSQPRDGLRMAWYEYELVVHC